MARRSLIEHLEYFHRHSSETAFVQHRGYRREVWTYQQVLELAWQFAHELRARNIRKGDHVLLWGANSAEWVAAFLGCMTQGVIAVPMDRIGAPEFTQRIFAGLQARLIVASADLLPHLKDFPALSFEDLPTALS